MVHKCKPIRQKPKQNPCFLSFLIHKNNTYSVFLLCLSSNISFRFIATCPKNLSSPTRDLCMTIRYRMYFSEFPSISNPGNSNEASSFQNGSRVFSATEVEYFSFPNCMIVYVSLVPLLPFGFRSLAWRTVTCTCVGNHFWVCSANIFFCFWEWWSKKQKQLTKTCYKSHFSKATLSWKVSPTPLISIHTSKGLNYVFVRYLTPMGQDSSRRLYPSTDFSFLPQPYNIIPPSVLPQRFSVKKKKSFHPQSVTTTFLPFSLVLNRVDFNRQKNLLEGPFFAMYPFGIQLRGNWAHKRLFFSFLEGRGSRPVG